MPTRRYAGSCRSRAAGSCCARYRWRRGGAVLVTEESKVVRATPFGDAAILVHCDGVDDASRVSTKCRRLVEQGSLRGVEDVVTGFGTVTLIVDPESVDVSGDMSWLASALDGAGDSLEEHETARPLEIPVCFDGPDLDDVGADSGLGAGGVVDALVRSELYVAFVGFSPGFAYLHGLPPSLAAVGRRASPRPRVTPGSFALAGGFAGVYAHATPGGWQLLGRTDIVAFDLERHQPSLFVPGQRVSIRATSSLAVPTPCGHGEGARQRPAVGAPAERVVHVERVQGLCIVEDHGRRGSAWMGVPRAGAADTDLRIVGNLLVGNDEAAAILELVGAVTLRPGCDTYLAVMTGPGSAPVAVHVEGSVAPTGTVIPVAAGQLIEIRSERRAVAALGGGITTEPVLGSMSSDLLAGLGPGKLSAGDEFGLGPARRARGSLRTAGYRASAEPLVLQVLRGPDAPPGMSAAELLAGTWTVDVNSDRVGVRLTHADDREPPGWASLGSVVSRGMVVGAVQCTPRGEAIVLGPDHATVGGYPVGAVVATVDVAKLARLAPGDAVQFAPIAVRDAVAELRRHRASLRTSVTGWFPIRTD
ncbi:MAG: 5-oxoprolinase subunit B/C family protein [Acidimicrobiales bacterium]